MADSKTVDVSLPLTRTKAEAWMKQRLIPFTHVVPGFARTSMRIRRGYLNDFRYEYDTEFRTRRTNTNPGKQKPRTVRKYAKNAARRPRGMRGGQVREISGLKVIRYGGEVDKIFYVDGDDGRPYQHECGSGQCSMLLVEHHSLGRGILIVSNNDLPLWEDA